jgi:hypothetical protein
MFAVVMVKPDERSRDLIRQTGRTCGNTTAGVRASSYFSISEAQFKRTESGAALDSRAHTLGRKGEGRFQIALAPPLKFTAAR